MTASSEPQPPTSPLAVIRAAERVRSELDAALRESGVQLPSLTLVAFTLAADPVRPLLDLGRCNVETAIALTTALRRPEGGRQ